MIDENGNLRLQVTAVYHWLKNAYLQNKYQFIVEEGGARSSKTTSICQFIIYFCLNHWQKKRITIVRKTLPSLRDSAMKTFFEELDKHELYIQDCHNKTENDYILNGNEIQFRSLDDPQKKRGAERDILWGNEANELTQEEFRQLNQRTNELVILDYNPSDEYHWIYDDITTREDCKLIKSTYLDNPFLSERLVNEIEHYKEVDPEYWKVYGLGLRATTPNTIYRNWRYIDTPPEPDEIIYGIDFGYSPHPKAVVECKIKDGVYYFRELLKEECLSTPDFIKKLKGWDGEKGLIPIITREVYCDSANPEGIAELRAAGFNAHKAQKDVNDGIEYLQFDIFYITKDSVELAKELRSYKWKTDKDGRITKEPIKLHDDLCLVGKTKILTSKGYKKIKNIKIGEYVYTRKGFKKVIHSRCTGIKQVYKYILQGNKIISTPNHRVITGRGKVEISTLINSDTLHIFAEKKKYLCQLKQLYLKELNSEELQIVKKEIIGFIFDAIVGITKKGLGIFTGKYGKTNMERYQRATIYTTKIATHLIIKLKILSAFLNIFIYHYTQKNITKTIRRKFYSTLKKSDRLQRSGMALKKARSGTVNMVKRFLGIENIKNLNVCFAGISTNQKIPEIQSSVQTNANQHTEEKSKKILLQECVSFAETNFKQTNTVNQDTAETPVPSKRIGKRKKVYNITVEDEHEYYANNILVANCDAIRYAAFSHYKRYYQGESNNMKKSDYDKMREQYKKTRKAKII